MRATKRNTVGHVRPGAGLAETKGAKLFLFLFLFLFV